MVKLSIRKAILIATAAGVALGSGAPAAARGGHHSPYAYGGGHHHGAYRGHVRRSNYYYGSRGYRRHHHHGLSGGEAALLAAGIIGGIILIDRAVENDRARNTRYDGYDRYDPYGDRAARDLYYRRDDRGPSDYEPDFDPDFDDENLDDALDGGGEADIGRRYNYGAAYNDCKAETREAARDSGVLVALPARPGRIEELDDGLGVRFTADFTAQGLRGDQILRTMTCEADETGVRFLEII